MTRNKLKNICPFIILFMLMFFVHMKMSTNLGDDAMFAEILKEKTLFMYMKELYMNINGKIFPDIMGVIFSSLPKAFFYFVSSAMYVIIAYCISILFLDNSIQAKYISVIGVLYFPVFILDSAGYIAVSTNYVWTCAMCLLALLPIRKYVNQQPLSVFSICVYTLSALYAGNQEQTSVLLCLIYICAMAAIIRQKRTREGKFVIFIGLLNIMSFLFICLAPGHAARIHAYNVYHIPNWTSLDIADKLYLGFTSTISHFINQTNLPFLLFAVFLMVLVFHKCHSWLYRAIGMVPICSYILLSGNAMYGGGGI